MNKTLLSAGLAFAIVLGASIPAQAGDYYGGSRYSRDPYDQCMTDRNGRRNTGAILGAVAGGLAGSGIASDKNREEGAILGAIVGAVGGAALGKTGIQCSNPGYSDNYRYEDDRYSGRDYGRYEDRHHDDDHDGYRHSGYRDANYRRDRGYEDDRYERDVSYGGRGECKVVYSTTRLPNGPTVREPATYCQDRDGVWTRRN